MRRNISLYIGGKLVEVDEDNLILFNYTQEELENPTIVKNSYSQQITLKGTPTNNKVFGSAFRLDRLNDSRFNARLKTDFVIYDEKGAILQMGYAKLDNISRTKSDISYKVTLYGSLGSFLYSLSYNSDGDKMTLADLTYVNDEDEEVSLSYTINRTLVQTAWNQLSGTHTNDLFDIINFAVAYNGIPEDFNADKVVFYDSNDEVNHLASVTRKYTEKEAHDFRSYLQRPVIRVKAILKAIEKFASDNGYTFAISQNWADEDNPYYEDMWMTLSIPKVVNEDTKMRSGETISQAALLGGTNSPAEFLLSYIKMFGLKILCENKTISIIERKAFFQDNTIDLTRRIDKGKGYDITPLIIDNKWYEMSSSDDSAFAETYKSTYGRSYGSQRINTGYEFNSETKQICDSIIFKGGVQSREVSSVFFDAYKNGQTPFPAMFIEGGTYKRIEGASQETHEYSVFLTGVYSYSWWDVTNNGYDKDDFVQLHKTDNKAMDGSNVLLFFDKMLVSPSQQLGISDDVPSLMEDKPCWNVSNTNRDALNELPHFSRFIISPSDETIETSLDWGEVRELNIPSLEYGQENIGVYVDRWRTYLADRYNENTKMVKVKVNLRGLNVGNELLRNFYWFDGCLWTLNKISNYSLTTYDDVECEFIQVQNKNRYLTGQIY